MTGSEVPSTNSSSVPPQGADPTTATGAGNVLKSKSGEEFTSASTFSSLENFRKRFPEMYDKFMKNVADCVITDMRKGAERVKKALKKMREN